MSSDRLSPVSVLNCDKVVLRRFLERLGLVSVLKVERLVLVLRVWENGISRSSLGLEGSTSRSCVGLEGRPSRSRLSLVT